MVFVHVMEADTAVHEFLEWATAKFTYKEPGYKELPDVRNCFPPIPTLLYFMFKNNL